MDFWHQQHNCVLLSPPRFPGSVHRFWWHEWDWPDKVRSKVMWKGWNIQYWYKELWIMLSIIRCGRKPAATMRAISVFWNVSITTARTQPPGVTSPTRYSCPIWLKQTVETCSSPLSASQTTNPLTSVMQNRKYTLQLRIALQFHTPLVNWNLDPTQIWYSRVVFWAAELH